MNAPLPASALRPAYVTVNDVCKVIRAYAERPASHDDLITIMACVASAVQKPSALDQPCVTVVVDMLDEITGQIEQDQVNQQQEAAWNARPDMIGFSGTYADLAALTIRGAK